MEACALDKDVTQLVRGDTTMVDERGAGLSASQRARIGLARALYVDADIYVLDDPLAAVDLLVPVTWTFIPAGHVPTRIQLEVVYCYRVAYLIAGQVARRLFRQCVVDLLRHKIRVVATHQLDYLQHADQILVLDEVYSLWNSI